MMNGAGVFCNLQFPRVVVNRAERVFRIDSETAALLDFICISKTSRRQILRSNLHNVFQTMGTIGVQEMESPIKIQ